MTKSLYWPSSVEALRAGACAAAIVLAMALHGCGGAGPEVTPVDAPPTAVSAGVPGTGASAPPPAPPASGVQPPVFVDPGPFLLTVTRAGVGQGRIQGRGIDCGADCSENLARGEPVTLNALAAQGSVFDGWGGACQGADPVCTVSLQQARSVVASFVPPRARDQPVDAVIAAMPPNSWKRLPGTLLKDHCPQPYQGYFCTSVVTAWSGAAYDERRDRMIVYGGGHSDSYYNILFSFDLATMRWERLNEMGGGATGNQPGAGWTDFRIEPCGFYPKGVLSIPDDVMIAGTNYVDPKKCFVEPLLSQLDLQQPRSPHSYGKIVVDWLRDRYCYIGGGNYPSAQTDSYVGYCFDPHAKTWERIAERSHTATGRGIAALDAAGVWWYLTNGNGPIRRYDPSTNVWTEFGNINYETGGGADIDRLRGHYYALVFKDDGYRLRRFDLRSTESLKARPAYAEINDVVGMPRELGTRPGFVYADARDRFFAWGGGGDVHVYDPQTRVWSVLQGSGDRPGAQQPNGTFGRWRYSAQRGVLVLVNSVTEDVYLFKPAP